MPGKEYEPRKAFLAEAVKERAPRLLIMQQHRIKGLEFALDFYGIGRKAQSQGQIAKRYGVHKPFVSQEIQVVLCYLGFESTWSNTTVSRVVTLLNKFFPKPDKMSSRKRRELEKRTESERLRLEMGWSDIPLDLSEAEREKSLLLLELYESRELERLKGMKRNGEEIYVAIILRYGLDAAGCYRSMEMVASAMDLTIPAVDARLRKGLRFVQNILAQSIRRERA